MTIVPERPTPTMYDDPTPDVLGEGFWARKLHLPPDDEGPVVSTLVSRRAERVTNRAVLYVHGFSDYFHQTGLADFHVARGEDFYAVDLHKYGRSLLPGQTPFQMAAIEDYFPELDAALAQIGADGHDEVLLSAHSTGGLALALWQHARSAAGRGTGATDRDPTPQDPTPRVVGMVLNSPFLELPAGWAVRTVAGTAVAMVARRRPLAAIPGLGESWYGHSIHRSSHGEWEFVQEWKPLRGGAVRAGWVAAARRAIAQAHAGLALPFPILVLCSWRALRARRWSEDLFTADAVLDPEAIARWSVRLGPQVTCIRIKDGMHDLLLSREPVRRRVLAEMSRWIDAYAPPAPNAQRSVRGA